MILKFKLKTFALAGLLAISFFSNQVLAQQWGDYTLYSTTGSTSSYLLDTNGTVVKTWTHGTAKTTYSCYLTPGGYLWRGVTKSGNSFTGGPISGQIQKWDWSGALVWDFVYSTTEYCTHHDFCVLPNGNVLLIAYERKSAAQVADAGSTFTNEVWSEKIVEVKPTGATTGEVVWEWKVWDHIVQNNNSAKANYQTSIVNNPQLLNVNYKISKDWIHMNGIDYNPMLDQIAWSSHNLNEWYIIDHSTSTAEAASHGGGNSGKGGDLLYRWGNPAAYGAAGTAVLNVTHDAHWIPEGYPNEGWLVGFNNKGVSASKSAVDQIVTPLNGYNYDITLGSAYEPSTYTRHACNGYTSNAGSSEQLPNGNMMVCIALSGYIYEIDPSGKSIWSKTVSGASQQAHRYNKCFTDNQPPAIPTIANNANVLSSSTATTYQWYVNGQKIDGANSKDYTPTKNGIYLVRITDNNGCVYRYSSGHKVTGLSTTFTINGPSNPISVCAGNSAQIIITTENENGNTTYSWTSNPAGFTSASKNITVTPTNNTTYKLVAINNGVKDSTTVLVTVNPKPNKPTITQNGTILNSSSGVSYTWYEDTMTISNAMGSTYTPTKTSSYRVKITDANGCQSNFSDAFAYTLGGIKNFQITHSFVLYPNPSNGKITVLNNSTIENVKLIISDVYGRTVLQTQNLENIDMVNFGNGVYFVKIYSKSHMLGTIKFNLIK